MMMFSPLTAFRPAVDAPVVGMVAASGDSKAKANEFCYGLPGAIGRRNNHRALSA